MRFRATSHHHTKNHPQSPARGNHRDHSPSHVGLSFLCARMLPRQHASPTSPRQLAPPPTHCRRDRTPLPTLAHLGHGPCLGGRSQTKRREADREKPTPASPPTGEGRAPPAVGDGGFLMWHPSHGGVAIEAQRAFITTTAQAEAATRPDLLQRRT
jgi:hypothetical protein